MLTKCLASFLENLEINLIIKISQIYERRNIDVNDVSVN